MLDPVTMMLLGKLKMLAKHAGMSIDLVKMTDGSDYAELTLNELSNVDDQELLPVALKLMSRLGLMGAPIDPGKTIGENEFDPYIKGVA